MEMVQAGMFLLFLTFSAWQDLRKKSIPAVIFWVFGALILGLWAGGIVLNWLGYGGMNLMGINGVSREGISAAGMNWEGAGWTKWTGLGQAARLTGQIASAAGGAAVGGGLMLANRLTEGEVGEGDGLFFMISGISLGLYKNILLLFGGLILCSSWCAVLMIYGMVSGKNIRKKEVAFLPFLLPAGIWVVFT